MAQQQPQNPTQPERGKEGITRITVGGFKSIVEEQSIEVRPLTILAGANSSGKSSIMQPLLLLKQTLEAPYTAAHSCSMGQMYGLLWSINYYLA